MDARLRIDDAYKRKLKRIKVRSVENSIQFATSYKAAKWKFYSFKYLIIIIVLGAFFTIISSPTIFYHNGTSHSVSRWIWGGSDHRYTSYLDINWEEISRALNQLPQNNYKKIQEVGILNFNENEIRKWKNVIPNANHTLLHLDYADETVTWESLYPEWIDEEQENEVPKCPSLPSIEIPRQRLDLVAVKLPCRSEGKWSRDITRLHLQVVAAEVAASCKGSYPPHVLFVTRCFPIPNLFTCKDLVAREGQIWLYKPDLSSLREKLRLPIGSCELALQLGENNTEEDHTRKRQREAYATILHSASVYVCGAIAAAQSLRMSGSTRDLVILVDETISHHHRAGLELAGWQVRTVERIRNPKAEKDAYNEWNYSKFRLWQLTDYDKVIFIDADLLILRNIDFLFRSPEISATGNNGHLFNSGVMVVEPSNCTFRLLMEHVDGIESYNGGDQGYLNEIFTWWHRVPRRVNFLKNFWAGDGPEARETKVRLFEAEPPVLHVLHYLGNKPWVCFRDYDCNWNVAKLQEFASDVAHARWWKVHDRMPEELQGYCMLRTIQKAQLEWDRREAEKANYSDGHWRIRVRDERLDKCIDRDCSWKGMLMHWDQEMDLFNVTTTNA
ncbi:hypothetical protein ABFS83_08G095200 [Erythranthe nasuta]